MQLVPHSSHRLPSGTNIMGTNGEREEGGNEKATGQVPSQRKPLRASLFEPSAIVQLQKEYKISQPYQHLVIPDLMDNKVLRGACEELKTNMQATLKETDIFKVGVSCQ